MLWLYKVQAAEETKGVAYGDNGLLKNSVLNRNLLQTFKKYTHAQESHIVLVLCSGSQKYPVPHGSTAWPFCCNSWTTPAFCCYSCRSHSLHTEDVFSAWALCCASHPPKLFLRMCGSSFCRSDSNVSFLVRFLWLHI